MQPEQKRALLAAKLRGLVADATGTTPEVEAFPMGAAGLSGTTAWVLGDPDVGVRVLGAALVWATRHRVDHVAVIVDDEAVAGIVARRAALFDLDIAVHRAEGRVLVNPEPAPVREPADLAPAAAAFADAIVAAGADPIVEHGVLVAEVDGLEVARTVVDDDGARLEIGVGRHDRLATAMVHAGEDPADGLRRVVAAVRRHRHPGAPHHPLNALAPERRLRHRLTLEPSIVGAAHLAPVPPVVPQDNLLDPAPAAAAGETEQGAPVLAVCSVGVDVDLVPVAADLRAVDGRDAALFLVVPEGDDHPVTRLLASHLHPPATVVAVPSSVS